VDGSGLTLARLRRSCTRRSESRRCEAVPTETPRSELFRNRAKQFQSLANDLQGSRRGYQDLAAAYEQLAIETERGEAIHAAAAPSAPSVHKAD